MGDQGLDQVCWVEGASSSGFPLSGLPYGVAKIESSFGIVTAIGDKVLDISACFAVGVLTVEGLDKSTLQDRTLNRFLGHRRKVLNRLRRSIQAILCDRKAIASVMGHLHARSDVEMVCPIEPGDFVDFYASFHHALRSNQAAGIEPAEPSVNWMSMPLGYYSRTSTITGSGVTIARPKGLRKTAAGPVLSRSRALDFELEIGVVCCGPPERVHIAPDEFSDRAFGIVLLNDWSARDIQGWESKPLGPFNSKSFATQIGDWVLPIEALNASRFKLQHQSELAKHLSHDSAWGVNFELEVELETQQARLSGKKGDVICETNLNCLFWDLSQLVSHATLNAPFVRPADLIGSGTLSGEAIESAACLLELTRAGRSPITLSTGEMRSWLEDGDKVMFRGQTETIAGESISIGELIGTVVDGHSSGAVN